VHISALDVVDLKKKIRKIATNTHLDMHVSIVNNFLKSIFRNIIINFRQRKKVKTLNNSKFYCVKVMCGI